VGHVSIRNALATAAALILPVLVSAGGDRLTHDHSKAEAASATDAPIQVTINPEARVSVAFSGRMPTASPCGQPTDFLVSVLNRGFVTAKLEARLVGDAPPGVKFEFRSEPLTGVTKETRTLKITLINAGPTDITIAFTTHNNVPDLAGRDRVHLLLLCSRPVS
jgi:hypothetical protein